MNTLTEGKPIDILMVEDSPIDILMTREALEQAKMLNVLHVVEDGAEAMAFLRKQGSHARAPRPDLVLLDLNLPKMDGREVLAEIKGDGSLKSIPVVILTTSKADRDVMEAYGLHANCYITKPVDFTSFVDVVQRIENFWLSVVTLPS